MNKIFKTLILSAALLSCAATAVAQSHYYHLVGDTVYGRSPIYYYDWWPDVDSMGLLPDSAISSYWPGTRFFLHTTSDTLKIIGIASTMAYLNMSDLTHPYEECDTTMDTAMYYTLFAATPNGPVELAKACWTADYNTCPKRYMALPYTYSYGEGSYYCKDTLHPTYNIASLREYYFNSPVIVTDSFYLGLEHLYRRTDNIDESTRNIYDQYSTVHVYRNGALHQYLPTAECTQKIPPQRIMYRRRPAPHVSDTSWKYTTETDIYQLVFPIIEVDTVGMPYDTSLFTCPVPETPTLISRGDYWARISWDDHDGNSNWMVSVVAAGGNPDNGRQIHATESPLYIYGLSPDTTYDIRVKGWCSKPMYEGWGDWSDPLTLDTVPAPQGIAAPANEKVTLSPNPARGTVTVTTESPQGTLAVVDMQGRQLLSMPLAGTETVVDIHTLAPGTYVVTLNTPQGHSSLQLTVE